MPSAQIALIKRLYQEFYNERNAASAAQAAPSIFRHPQQYIKEYTALRKTFPDMAINPEVIFEADNHVVVRWSLRGTQSGDFHLPQVSLTIPATEVFVTTLGISIFEVSDGLIDSGIWASSDGLSMLRQLGVRFQPPTTPPASSPPRSPRPPRQPRPPSAARSPRSPRTRRPPDPLLPE